MTSDQDFVVFQGDVFEASSSHLTEEGEDNSFSTELRDNFFSEKVPLTSWEVVAKGVTCSTTWKGIP